MQSRDMLENDLEPGEEIQKLPDKGYKQILNFKRMGRELAMQYLFQCDIANESEKQETLESFWEQAEESGAFTVKRTFQRAQNYALKLIYGVQQNLSEIDDLMQGVSSQWNLNRMSVVDRNIMRVAIYELKYCPDIPVAVCIDEAIEIAKDFSDQNSGMFINGLLNAIKIKLYPDMEKTKKRQSDVEKQKD